MSSTAGNNGRGKDYNLSQIVALSDTYSRILKACRRLPALTIATPVLLKVVCFLTDGITKNHSLLTLVLTTFLTIGFRQIARSSAPSAKVADETLARNELRIISGTFTLSALVSRYLVARIEGPLGLTNVLTCSLNISFELAVRFALGMFFLGIAVICQYIGPASVVRCSSSPLLENPSSIWIKCATAYLQQSPAALLEFITRPNESNASNTRWPNAFNTRRLQRPILRVTIQLLLSSIISGSLVAYTSLVPLFTARFPTCSPNRIVASCIFATVINLLMRLDGSSHELSPSRHQFGLSSHRGLFGALHFSNISFLISSTLVPILALISTSLGSEEIETGALISFILSIVITWLVILYLNIFDQELRKVLCTPPLNMKKIVDEIVVDDRMQTYLEVTMCSLLHSDLALVEQLSSNGKLRLLSLDREERVLNEEAMKTMANNLLQKTSGDANSAHLEEDILRLSILSSLGGLGIGDSTFDDAGIHHAENIKQWVHPKGTMQVGGSRSEIVSVPLVRALCAYAGGLGEALIMCSAQAMTTPIFPWSLPPGALVQSEYAIRAAARCIVCNLANSAQCRTDWRSSHLSMMIPVLMNSACRLQTGAVQYAEKTKASKQRVAAIAANKTVKSRAIAINLEAHFDPDQDRRLLQTESPELLRIYNACNRSAAMVLEKLHSLEGARGFELGLEGLTRKWVSHVIASMPNQSSNAVMPAAY